MTITVTDALAGIIRQVDNDNTMPASSLGREIAWHHCAPKSLARTSAADVAAFVERTNPDKRMGAGELAELIVAEFDLDKEH